jgi:hypothetical protein
MAREVRGNVLRLQPQGRTTVLLAIDGERDSNHLRWHTYTLRQDEGPAVVDEVGNRGGRSLLRWANCDERESQQGKAGE